MGFFLGGGFFKSLHKLRKIKAKADIIEVTESIKLKASFKLQNQATPEAEFIPQQYPVIEANKFFRLLCSFPWSQEH